MTKRDIVEKIAAQTSFSQREVNEILQRSLDAVQEGLMQGESVHFRGFGVFHVVERKARPGRNPKRPQDMVMIPARKAVKFKTGKALKAMLAGRQAQVGE